ncbi:thiol peroxidase [Enterobacter mori]
MNSRVRFNEASVTLYGTFPEKGGRIPGFSLVNSALEKWSYNEFFDKNILIYFFPSVDTSVCSNSLKKINEMAQKFPSLKIICISADLPFAQGRFIDDNQLNHITMLSTYLNEQVKIIFGVAIADSPLVGLCARGVILADVCGNIQYSQLVPDITTEPDYKSLEFAIKVASDNI